MDGAITGPDLDSSAIRLLGSLQAILTRESTGLTETDSKTVVVVAVVGGVGGAVGGAAVDRIVVPGTTTQPKDPAHLIIAQAV